MATIVHVIGANSGRNGDISRGHADRRTGRCDTCGAKDDKTLGVGVMSRGSGDATCSVVGESAGSGDASRRSSDVSVGHGDAPRAVADISLSYAAICVRFAKRHKGRLAVSV